MPDLQWNATFWSGNYDWSAGGEEWSEAWGCSEAQWFGSLYPRLHRFLPAPRILEIAPGFGRWTQYLLRNCTAYLGIDISAECVAACRKTFARAAHARFVHNDGQSLDAAEDGSIDLLFSFDSLVHVDIEILEAYVPQILRKLAPGGVAFVHHSNLLAFRGAIVNEHMRATTVSADNVRALAERHGGNILIQELINWGSEHTQDCLTLFCRDTGADTPPAVTLHNPRFMAEASIIRDFQSAYSFPARAVR